MHERVVSTVGMNHIYEHVSMCSEYKLTTIDVTAQFNTVFRLT